jgi:uncharacterized sulfatase
MRFSPERWFANRHTHPGTTMNRSIVYLLLSVVSSLFPVAGLVQVTSATECPNVIVIFTDDHGFADLSSQGIHTDVKTPHIDRLTAEGVRMTSGYVTAPQCVPSRAGLLSGRYQNRFGIESNGRPLDGFNAQQTIAERLRGAGYATGMTGKWHLGPPSEIVAHGFEDVFQKNANRPGWANFDLDGNDRTPGVEKTDLYHLDANSAAACAFIKRHHDEPFFFYCAYRAPHVPLDAPPRYLKRFPGKMPERRRQALAMISAIDDGVGRMMSTLRQYRIEERTLIFLIGDNGAPLKIHKLDTPGGGPGWDGSLNDPLNGEKGMLAEGGIRVPFVAYWRGRIGGGQVYDHPVISLDVAATAIALADLPEDPELDGVNLIPYLRGEAEGAPHDTLYWRWIAQSAVREGRWKYLRGGAREYLFDLESDREEKRNLLAKHPEIVDRLRTKLARWAQELNPPGLETQQMSATWEQYYDYYLDGKPAPAPRAAGKRRKSVRADELQGWIARNSIAALKDGALQVTPDKVARQRPFIACAKLNIPGPAVFSLQLRSNTGGSAGLAWRTRGQQDFPPDQQVLLQISASDDWQRITAEVPGRGRIIHIRVLLPEGESSIRRIGVTSMEGDGGKTWKFSEPFRRSD